VLIRPDPQLPETLHANGTLEAITENDIYATMQDVFLAYQNDRTHRR
jgi:hypothetical protein